MRWCLQLRVVADEFLFGTQPIFHVVAILLATRFVQTVGELGNLVVCSGQSAAGVLSHAHFTRDARRCPVEAGSGKPTTLYSSTSGWPPMLSLRTE